MLYQTGFQRLKTLNWQSQINCKVMLFAKYDRDIFNTYLSPEWANKNSSFEIGQTPNYIAVMTVRLNYNFLATVVTLAYLQSDEPPFITNFLSRDFNFSLSDVFLKRHKIDEKQLWNCITRKVSREIDELSNCIQEFCTSEEDIELLINNINSGLFLVNQEKLNEQIIEKN